MKKILLFEDDQALAMATSFALETENFNVTQKKLLRMTHFHLCFWMSIFQTE